MFINPPLITELMDGELIAAGIFYGVLAIIIYLNRKKFTWMQGIIYAFKTKRPLKWMDKLRPNNIFWKIFGTFCIPLGFYYMPQLIYLLGQKAIEIILNPASSAGVALAIPGVRIPGSPIYIPLLYGVVSIGVLAFVHEMAHGIIGKSEGIKIKSSGFGMFLIFPLFFVEPDEKSLVKASKLSRLRMLSAGAGANISLSFILFLIASFTFVPFFIDNTVYKGLSVNSLVEDYPAIQANITTNTVITGINGFETLNLTGFTKVMRTIEPGTVITLNTNQGDFELTTVTNPQNDSLSYLGVFLDEVIEFSDKAKINYGETILWLIRVIYDLLLWIGFLNLSIGVMNLLPIWGLDGSKMLYDLLSYVVKEKHARTIVSIASSLSIGLLIVNIAPVFINLFA